MNHEFSRASAARHGLAHCSTCGFLAPVKEEVCPRCRSTLHLRHPQSLQRTWALLIASLLLYFPANALPILRVESGNGVQESTIMRGVIQFWQEKDYPIAIVIFTASIVIPVLKILALAVLCIAAQTGKRPHLMTRIYRVTEVIGRWSMIDIFVVAIMVALVQLGSVMSILPGPAVLSFAAVVILTMIGAMTFDPRLIWDAAYRVEQTNKHKHA